jgi:hypothetical protein
MRRICSAAGRLKMIKRQMFGRASLAVLRARIVPAAEAMLKRWLTAVMGEDAFGEEVKEA